MQGIIDKSLSLEDTCVEFNIPSSSVIIQWQKNYQKQGVLGLQNKPKGRPKPMTFKRTKKKSTKPLTREDERDYFCATKPKSYKVVHRAKERQSCLYVKQSFKILHKICKFIYQFSAMNQLSFYNFCINPT
ncbi:helix-turn-helix domain-containing protein [Flavobacterium gelatinilyticum]|uniref:helix-turn-helix domain-containing protein n=1 Tax=Flavobacterium gelatinilyticum TaxID=3003260 RepID=UPI002481215C|nr:hypothetical protein [Flavobacterium gelatinilyticum]